jgi:hypothetical protein
MADQRVDSDSAETHPEAQTAFSRFSRLPTEIRVKIWHYAMPRVVHIGLKDANHTSKSEQSKYPVLSAVNRESREVALKDLKRYTKFSDEKPIYVDFGLDIFYISRFDTSGLDKANYDSYIQVLALNSKYLANSPREFLQMVRRCSHLRKLVLVMPGKETALQDPDNERVVREETTTLQYLLDLGNERIVRNVTADFKAVGKLWNSSWSWPDVYLIRHPIVTDKAEQKAAEQEVASLFSSARNRIKQKSLPSYRGPRNPPRPLKYGDLKRALSLRPCPGTM